MRRAGSLDRRRGPLDRRRPFAAQHEAAQLELPVGGTGLARPQLDAARHRRHARRPRQHEVRRDECSAARERVELSRDPGIEIDAATERQAERAADRGEVGRGELHFQRIAGMAQGAARDEARGTERQVRLRSREARSIAGERHAARGGKPRVAAVRDHQQHFARRLPREAAARGNRCVQFARRHLGECRRIEPLDAPLDLELTVARQRERAARFRKRAAAREPGALDAEPPVRDARLAANLETRILESHRVRLRLAARDCRNLPGELRGPERGMPGEQVAIRHGEPRIQLSAGPQRPPLRGAASRDAQHQVRRLHAILRDGEDPGRQRDREALLVERAGVRIRDLHRPLEDCAFPRRQVDPDRELRARHGSERGEVQPLELHGELPQRHRGVRFQLRARAAGEPAFARVERRIDPGQDTRRRQRRAVVGCVARPRELALQLERERGPCPEGAGEFRATDGCGRLGARQRPSRMVRREGERYLAQLDAAPVLAESGEGKPAHAGAFDVEPHRERERPGREGRLARRGRRDLDRGGMQALDAHFVAEQAGRRPVERHLPGAQAKPGRGELDRIDGERSGQAAIDRAERSSGQRNGAPEHELRARIGRQDPERDSRDERCRHAREPRATDQQRGVVARGCGRCSWRAQNATATEKTSRALRSRSA